MYRILVDMQSGNTPFHRKHRGYVGGLVLITYSLFLVYRARRRAIGGEISPYSLLELRDSPWILGWIASLVLGAVREFAYFVPVGFGATVVAHLGSKWFGRFLAAAIGIMAFVYLTRIAAIWAVVDLVFPLLGCLFGAWAGVTWFRGWRARLWFLPKVALLGFLIAFCLGIAVRLFLEDTPFPFEAAPVTSSEKQRLMHLVLSKKPQSLEETQTHTLRLTEHDVNVLLSWHLSLESLKRKAMVRLGRDSVSLLMSLPAQLGGGRTRYMNLKIVSNAGIEDGVLRLRVNQLRIGSLEFPRWFVRSLGPVLTSRLHRDHQVKPFLSGARRMAIEPNAIQFTYGLFDPPARIPEQPIRPSVVSEELLASTRAQVDHLLLLFAANPLPDQSPSFNLCLKTAFALARDRSTQRDAVAENKAAVLALGILLGHPSIEDFLGPVLDDRNRDEARKALLRVVLHGRPDWTKHFCVSAVIASLSDENTSNACGLLKEELDTDTDGGGFSFADLLMDRAGTVFAVRATRDEAAARTMQHHLAGGFRIESICPLADDLPEGVSQADLKSHYGGVGGEGYRQMVEEIERRVAACAAYR